MLSQSSMVLDKRSRSSSVLQRKDWKRESCGLAKAASSGRATLSFSVLGMAGSLFAACLPPCFQLFPDHIEGKAHPALIPGDRHNLFAQRLVDAPVKINEPARLHLDKGRLHIQPTCNGGCVALLPPYSAASRG